MSDKVKNVTDKTKPIDEDLNPDGSKKAGVESDGGSVAPNGETPSVPASSVTKSKDLLDGPKKFTGV